MNIFDELEKQYNEIDLEYSQITFEAMSKGWNRKEALYQRKRDLNDQAYFLFMFTRLEEKIREESNTLIDGKQNSIISWKQRAPWDILNGDVHFKKRLALLTERGSSDFNKVIDYYNMRNSIAHGESISSISMPIVIPEFKRLYKVLKS